MDDDRDGRISSKEWRSADERLRKLDINDDELIGATELVPSILYPGAAGTNALHRDDIVQSPVDKTSSTSVARLVSCAAQSPQQFASMLEALMRETLNNRTFPPVTVHPWSLSITDSLSGKVPSDAHASLQGIELWTVPGPLPQRLLDLLAQLPETVDTPESEEPSTNDGPRDRQLRFNWLLSVADRNRDGIASQDEIQQWLELQRRLNHGHLLVNDLNRRRPIRTARHESRWWSSTARVAQCLGTFRRLGLSDGDHTAIDRLPSLTLVIASQGFPESLALQEKTKVEWFHKMDRNDDGDVSRREFTGPREAFERLDKDHDGLLSSAEATAR